jgi:PAS domain S-box-containing protein
VVRRWASTAVEAAVVAVAYYGSAKLGLSLAHENSSITAVWAPSGIALATLILRGSRAWPGVALGAFLANAGTTAPLVSVVGITLGNTSEALLGAYLLRRSGFQPSLSRARDVIALVVLAALASTTVSATVGVASLAVGGVIESGRMGFAWLLWWLGDLGGDLLVAPLILVLAAGGLRQIRGRSLALAALMLAGVLGVGLIVFIGLVPRSYLIFPLLITAALRFGLPGATVASFATAVVAVAFTAVGTGPFAEGSPDGDLLVAETFCAVGAVTALALAALMTERVAARAGLEEARNDLETRVLDRTAELVEREHQLAVAQELARFGSWEWEVDPNVVSWSDELYRLFGVEPVGRRVTYETFLDLVHPDDRAYVSSTIGRAFEQGTPFEVEHRVVRPDGRVRWLHGRGRVEMGEQGPIRMSGTAQDITQRKELERLKDDFVATVSHELRTPLTSIAGYVDLIKGGHAGALTDEQRGLLSVVERNADRLTRLVEDLLLISQVESRQILLRREPVGLIEIVMEAVEAARPVASERDVGLTLETETVEAVMGDRLRLAQSIDNLLANALKFTPPGGRVDVQVAGGAGVARVQVSDTGIGIPEDEQGRLFERFYRGSGSTAATVPGTGLGLAIAKEIVEGHDGSIGVRSAPGAGATFHIELPTVGGGARAERGGGDRVASRGRVS